MKTLADWLRKLANWMDPPVNPNEGGPPPTPPDFAPPPQQ